MRAEIIECEGYKSLRAAVDYSSSRYSKADGRDYEKYFQWVIDRLLHYEEKLEIPAEELLNRWEEERDYWFVNYYQECNFPKIDSGRVRVFDTSEELHKSVGDTGFRCPKCSKVSKNPYECDAGDGCDWKIYGFLRDLGKGIMVYVKEKVDMNLIFMPVAWENTDSE